MSSDQRRPGLDGRDAPVGAGYVEGLDGLRALSITLVVLGHLGFGALAPGGLGVTLFFFISGFLITSLLVRERQRFGRLDLPRFYARRLPRLLPELLALLAVLEFVGGPLLGRPLPLSALLGALFYATNYLVIFAPQSCAHCAVTGHLWSLAVEEHFYLVAPLALSVLDFRRRRMVWMFAAAILLAMTWRAVAALVLKLPEIYTYKATECRLDSIAWGCLAAVLFETRGAAKTAVGGAERAGAAIMTVTGTALLMVSLLYRDEGFRASFRYSLQGLAFLLIIPPLARAPALRPVRRILETAPLRWMGRRSYGAYLWHYLALGLAAAVLGVSGDIENAPLAQRLAATPMVLVLVWAFAALSTRFVFAPAQRLKPLFEPRAQTVPGRLFGYDISPLGPDATVEALLEPAPPGGGARLVVTMNLDHVVRLRRAASFRRAYAGAAVVTLDGAPVWLYARLRGLNIPRCTGADMFADLAGRLCPTVHRPFFVLSGDLAAERLRRRLQDRGFPAATLGFAVPPFGFETDPVACAELALRIRAHGASHLVMAVGAPKSEVFVDAWRHRLGDVHALCCGSAPDFFVGVRRRAPKILQRLGLEWLWRTLEEPKRLVRRYLLDSWAFLPAVLEDLSRPATAVSETRGGDLNRPLGRDLGGTLIR